MHSRNKSNPAVITVRPTVIRPSGQAPTPSDDFHRRFSRPITISVVMVACTWLVHLIASKFSGIAGMWIAIVGMVATGALLYRELLMSGLILNRIIGALIVLVTAPLSGIFALMPFALLHMNPTLFSAISVGLAIGWIAHTLSLINEGEPPCSAA